MDKGVFFEYEYKIEGLENQYLVTIGKEDCELPEKL
jgi:hypothetical protein